MRSPGAKALLLSSIAAVFVSTSRPVRIIDADLVLLNGNVITVDASDRIAQAVAITGNRITAVGTNDEIAQRAGPRTQRIDLHGLTVTPGLLDAHAHFNWGGAERLYSLDLSYPGVKNIPQVAAKLAARAASAPPGSFIQGVEWDDGKLEERRKLT